MPLKNADKQGLLDGRLLADFTCGMPAANFWQTDNVAALRLSKIKTGSK